LRHAARVAVLTTDGRTFTREILHRPGSPENPVNREDIERKFDANVSQFLKSSTMDRLKYLAARLEVLTNAKEIIDIVAFPFEKTEL
jgi:2-methylcitrate dehydratase PrpD